MASENEQKRIRRALLSVTDKTGLVEFARALADFGVELVSTGGTAKALREAGLTVKDISELTGFPEMLDGRVKTLHPRVHGGLLYIRGNAEHEAAVAAHGIEPIDMVVVNLYAFEKTAAQPGVAFGHLIENIDIGGPSMVRSAAKNFEDVAIVTRVSDYPALIEELKANQRSAEPRHALAAGQAGLCHHGCLRCGHRRHAGADRGSSCARCSGRSRRSPPSRPRCASTFRWRRPCATARTRTSAPRFTPTAPGCGIAGANQLQGKELSFNNLVDLDACWELAQEFEEPAVIIVKHTNPCGAATGCFDPRGLPEGAGLRSGFGLRRRHRHQPRSGRRRSRRDRQAIRRGHRRAGLLRRSPRALRGQKESAPG